ncbi:helix-turn-helix domain-containing protein [Sporosarcina sp. YIM B06819]|uniref:helix-turn-helix domain-containing protein n=1 Tax=Sporosarcina sp. YIM B06819 TaxID=3081769 RepID=UPI00298BECA7|nr:helix-turn-helix domain-containing protein [Sporosarcina sp. YIM B06819]
MFNSFEKVTIFRKLFLSYILILVIPLVTSFIVYQVSIFEINENATQKSKNLLNQTRDIIDRKNEELETFVYQLSLNPEINELMNRKSNQDKNTVYDTYKVLNSIKNYQYTNTIYQDFYIYFNQIDTIISPESTYVRTDDFYKSHRYDGLNYNDWMKDINQTYHTRLYIPSNKVNIGNKSESIITYVQSIPFNTTKSQKANIVVMIKEKEIASILNRISSQYDGSAFILDEEGNIMVSDNIDKSMISYDKTSNKRMINESNKKFMYIKSKSNLNEWTYVAIISKEKLAEDIKYIQTIAFLIAITTIVIGLCIAILFSYQHSIPLNRLLRIIPLSETKKVSDPYDYLHTNIEEMLENNDRLRNQIQNQRPILQDTVLRKLVSGEYSTSKEAIILIEQANLPIKGAFGYVGIVQIVHVMNAIDKNMLDEMNVAQLFIQNELTDIFRGEALQYNLDVDKVVFLFSYYKKITHHEEKKVKEALELLIKRLEENYSLKVNIGFGRPFEQFSDIYKSFEEAKMSLPLFQSIDHEAALYIYVNQYEERNNDYYYPIEIELRLINAVMNGETDEVKELLDKLFSENALKRELTNQTGIQLFTSLTGTILRILSKNTELKKVMVDEIYDRMEELNARKSVFTKDIEQIRQIIVEISQCISERKIVSGQQVIDNMKVYIKKNFKDPDFTIYKMSKAIGFPEKMVSSIFKEHVGMNISDYIEEVRINFAKSKLIQTEESIEDIALQSGYNSAHAFRRAFKRNVGSTPRDYKSMMKNSF